MNLLRFQQMCTNDVCLRQTDGLICKSHQHYITIALTQTYYSMPCSLTDSGSYTRSFLRTQTRRTKEGLNPTSEKRGVEKEGRSGRERVRERGRERAREREGKGEGPYKTSGTQATLYPASLSRSASIHRKHTQTPPALKHSLT